MILTTGLLTIYNIINSKNKPSQNNALNANARQHPTRKANAPAATA